MNYLVRNCQVPGYATLVDVLLAETRIERIGPSLDSPVDAREIDADGGALLPGLRDHHIHLLSLAAALESVNCGPPEVNNEDDLASLLVRENLAAGDKWLRGTGYHDSVAGDIDRHWLDRHIPDRPARIQHRGGRLWVLNSAALADLGLLSGTQANAVPKGVQWHQGQPSGRLYECDHWLRQRMGSRFPDLARASSELAQYGITHITDTTPHNDPVMWRHFQQSRNDGQLIQDVRMMGSLALGDVESCAGLTLGEYKVHLLESQLPDIDSLCQRMRSAHAQGRAVAVHCVTLTELVFTLACFESVGTVPGDRIEHAAVAPPLQLEKMRELGLRVVTQPHFIYERGEHYRTDVEPGDQPWLYRLRGLLDAGIPLAAGSDAAFGGSNPWQAMAAATTRATRAGHIIGEMEALSPTQALALYTSEAHAPGVEQARLAPGTAANLCLLRQDWQAAAQDLVRVEVVATWRDGQLIHDSVDQSPVEGRSTVDPAPA